MMNVEEYLKQGKQLHDEGYETDGCTAVGWLVNRFWPRLEAACWSHDFARRNMIPSGGDEQDDLLFKKALEHLHAPKLLSWLMYKAVRFQSKTGMDPAPLIGAAFMLLLIVLAFWHSSTK